MRRELPEATQRFAGIDAAVRAVLLDMVVAKNCVACCTKEGLLRHLEAQQGELELCEKVGAGHPAGAGGAWLRAWFAVAASVRESSMLPGTLAAGVQHPLLRPASCLRGQHQR